MLGSAPHPQPDAGGTTPFDRTSWISFGVEVLRAGIDAAQT